MALLAFEGVAKTYWRGRHEVVVLDDVSFELAAGELAAVFGQRGAGKTTLLRVAAGVEPPDAGVVRFAGGELRAARRARLDGLDRRIGLVRRAGPLMPAMQLLDYVALPLLGEVHHREAHRRATRTLKQLRAAELVGARWDELSDAERTLALIARAIVREPALLIADDPTLGLDVEERELVLGLLRAIAEESGTAVLMTVTEVPDMLRSHRLMSLSGGELIQPTRRGTAEVIELARRRGGAGTA